MNEPKKPSDWTEKEIQNKIITTALFFWLLGVCVIFTVGCVTYYYIGPIFGEGKTGFQISGLVVAGIIAHYSHRVFRFIENVGKEDHDDDDVQ